MAKETGWDAAANENFIDAGNWDNGVAVADDTIDIDTATLPTSNLPAAGTFHFLLDSALSLAAGAYIDVGGGAVVGNLEVNHSSGVLDPGSGVFGTATATIGSILLDGAAYAGDVALAGGALILYDSATLNGEIDASADSAIDWSDSGTVNGKINAFSNTITHTNTDGASLTVDNPGDLDLGGDAGKLAVEIDIVGLIWNMSACKIGSYLNTAGDLRGSANFEVAGDIILVVGESTFTGDMIQTASGNVEWDSAAYPLAGLVLGGTDVVSTLTKHARCKEFTHGAGTVTTDTGKVVVIYADDDDFFTAGTGDMNINVSLSATVVVNNADQIILNDKQLGCCGADTLAVTLSGGADIGAGELKVYAAAIGEKAYYEIGNLTCGAVTIGSIANRPASLTMLGPWNVASIAAGVAGGDLHFGSQDGRTSGTVDGTDLACDAGTARVLAGTFQDIDLSSGRFIKWSLPGAGNTPNVEDCPRGLGIMPLATAA